MSTAGEESNQDCITLKNNCDKEILRIEKLHADVRQMSERLEGAWCDAWNIATTCSVKLGYSATNSLEALPQFDSFTSLPRYGNNVESISSSSNPPVWPVLYLYPQYNQIDINHGVHGEDMLVEHVAAMFPEEDDGK